MPNTSSRAGAVRPSRPEPRPGRALVLFSITLLALAGILGVGKWRSDADFTPDLALDLQGGTQLILTPKSTDGSAVTESDVEQAISVIRKRVDASGVSEAEITSQGGSNVVVALAGTPSQETLDLVRTSAVLTFRPVLAIGAPQAQPAPGAGDPSATAAPSPTPAPSELSDEPTSQPTDPSDPAWVTDKVAADFAALDCTQVSNLKGFGDADPQRALATCSVDGTEKYILGPVEIEGVRIKSASSGMGHDNLGNPNGEWQVGLEFDSEGTDQFLAISQRLVQLRASDPVRNRFGIVLDGLVISAPSMNDVIPSGQASISGRFDAQSAATLANQLNFGALPLNFEVQSEEQISATLGSEQLAKSILFGLVGLGLVVLYLLLQYRGLAIVATGSLVAAAVLTYLLITLFSWLLGYRLSLPGVAGLIVAVGVTADSFIVYFERIRDEIRDGLDIPQAVNTAWKRAKRTIVISDFINIIAAIVLYVLAVGGVRGFAFTLGLTTFIDLLVVFGFTHPLMLLFMKLNFFRSGHRLSGINPEMLGSKAPVYTGRGTTRSPGIARRKAQAAAAAAEKEAE